VTLREERCPTCDGTGSIARDNQQYPCPTCSPSSEESVPYLAPNDSHDSSALRLARTAAYVVGVAAVVAVMALLIKAAWQ
jgi:DnaJ-class molecular chaperone